MLERPLAAAALAVVLGTAACGGAAKGTAAGGSPKADPSAPIKSSLRLAFVPQQVDDPYEKLVDAAGIAGAKEFNARADEVGPSRASASSQVPYLNTLVRQRPDAILVAANDAAAVCPPLKQAMARKIAVVTYGSDATKDCRNVFVNQASSENVGRSQVTLMSDLLGGKGQIAILAGTAGATDQKTWIRYMKDELKKPEYSGITLVKVVYGDDDDQKSYQRAQDLLATYPELKGIIAPTTVGIAAAARYVAGSSYKGKVEVTGLGTPNRMRAYVENGTVHKFELWDPGNLGYLAVYTAAALVSGQITGAQGQTFQAGKLGPRTIGKDGEIVLGPPTVFDKTNIGDYHF